MKPETTDLLDYLQRELCTADGSIFCAECADCEMPCDEECGKTCKAWYAIEAINDCRYRLLDVLEVVSHE